MKSHTTLAAVSLAALISFWTMPPAAFAADTDAAYQDIEATYGLVPGFFRLFPAEIVPEAWEAFRALQLNPDVGIDAKSRELIGVALAAQVECQPCLYLHVAAATANGAAEAEIVATAALVTATHRLHATLKQSKAEPSALMRETDLVLWGDPQTAERGRPTLDISQLRSASSSCD